MPYIKTRSAVASAGIDCTLFSSHIRYHRLWKPRQWNPASDVGGMYHRCMVNLHTPDTELINKLCYFSCRGGANAVCISLSLSRYQFCRHTTDSEKNLIITSVYGTCYIIIISRVILILRKKGHR